MKAPAAAWLALVGGGLLFAVVSADVVYDRRAAGLPGGQSPLESAPAGSLPNTVRLRGLPLVFEENVGQANASVRFLARAAGVTLQVTRDGELVALFPPPAGHRPGLREGGRGEAPARVVALRAELVGGQRPARVAGERPLAARVNYLKGRKPDRWFTGIRSFGSVRCEEVYPGTDLVVYGTSRGLEFDFNLAPGADPRLIELRFAALDGTKLAPQLTPDGGLSMQIAGVTLDVGAPEVYQEIGGIRLPIAGRLQLRDGGRLSFMVGAYERGAPLVIDPILQYSSRLGGSGTDSAYGITLDTQGSPYLVGSTASADFPVTSGSFSGSLSGFTDAFVAKLTPDGQHLAYLTFIGGSHFDDGYGIAVDSTGSAVITGVTSSSDFPTTPGAFQTVTRGNVDGFVTRLTPQGDGLVYSTLLGSSGEDWLMSIALDQSGSAYVGGHTHGTNFPSTPEAYRTSTNGLDATVTKLAPDGRTLVYSTFLGGGNRFVYGVAVDQQGSAYVTGWVGTAANARGLVTKLAPDGKSLTYSKVFPGSTTGGSIAVDEAGSAYVLFTTIGSGFTTTAGAFATRPSGGGDVAVAKLDPTGSALIYATFLGGSGGEWDLGNDGHFKGQLGLAVGPHGEAWVVGSTTSADFPTTQDAWSRSMAGGRLDCFIAKLSPTGTALQYGTYLGGGGIDAPESVAIDQAGDAWVVGQTSSNDFPATPGAPSFGTKGGLGDVFVVRVGEAACSSSVPAQGLPGEAVTFAGPSTLADGSPVLTYDWEFGDGSPHSNQQSPTHAYASSGVYTWVLVSTSATGTCNAKGTIELKPAGRSVRHRLRRG